MPHLGQLRMDPKVVAVVALQHNKDKGRIGGVVVRIQHLATAQIQPAAEVHIRLAGEDRIQLAEMDRTPHAVALHTLLEGTDHSTLPEADVRTLLEVMDRTPVAKSHTPHTLPEGPETHKPAANDRAHRESPPIFEAEVPIH
jgi:hypothetical protein